MKKFLLFISILGLPFTIVGCDEITSIINQNDEVVFTLDDLAIYNGQNGQKVYTAVNGVVYYVTNTFPNGVVYYVTNAFPNGVHQGMQLAGTDATAAFTSSPHAMSILNELPIVGTLEGFPRLSATQASASNVGVDYEDDDYDEDQDEESYIVPSELPAAILDYLSINYPNIAIDEAELEDGIYEIELVNGLELEFDINGNFLSVEIDD